VCVAALCTGSASLTQAAPKDTTKDSKHAPSRVLIVVFDQMRPEYAQRFEMRHVLQLQKEGVNFKNGYLGHMPSETVISHNVMVSGVFPKKMGWVDEAYRDTGNLFGKGANAMWVTGDFSRAQFDTLVAQGKYPKLADYLHRAQPGRKFIVVGQKGYAVDSIAAPSADIAVKLSGRQKVNNKKADGTVESGCTELGGQYRHPDGSNVPSYLMEPKCGRFYINSDKSNAYGTTAASPSWLYPLDGDRFVPGTNAEHLGGDAWVADAAMVMMEKEDWSGMLVTFGSIDKAGHMWGAHHDQGGKPDSPDEGTHVPVVARYADEQFGRVLAKLKSLGQLDDTLIVITSDHGATYAEQFHGADTAGISDNNWYFGESVNSGAFDKPLPALKPLYDTGNVQFSYQSTALEAWLKDNSAEKKREAAKVMRGLPGVVATYWREGGKYKLDTANRGTHATMGTAEQAWWKKHGQELVDTMASDQGPDVIAWLKDGVGYGVHGDHGSGKENDQRVPMVLWSARIRADQPNAAFRTVDILPTVLRAMQIKQDSAADGKAWPLSFR
jgi:hypothetical protein